MDLSSLSPKEAYIKLLKWMAVRDTQHLVVPQAWQELHPKAEPPADAPTNPQLLYEMLQQINHQYPHIRTDDIQFAAALYKQAMPDFHS